MLSKTFSKMYNNKHFIANNLTSFYCKFWEFVRQFSNDLQIKYRYYEAKNTVFWKVFVLPPNNLRQFRFLFYLVGIANNLYVIWHLCLILRLAGTELKMAEDEINGDSDEIQEKSQKKTAKYDSGAADLEKVTDYAEEKEISTQDFSGVNFSHVLLIHFLNNNLILFRRLQR